MSEQTMSEETSQSNVDELTLLKERAKTLGIPVSGNIGVDKLKQKIANKLAGDSEKSEEDTRQDAAMSQRETEQQLRKRLQKEAMALIRCRIYNLNPSKRDLSGEIITVGNRYIGTVKKFIPFGEQTENGYHIPKILFDDLKRRKFQQIRTTRKKGQIEVKSRMVPEYNLEILPALTKEELAELALRQEAAERVSVD